MYLPCCGGSAWPTAAPGFLVTFPSCYVTLGLCRRRSMDRWSSARAQLSRHMVACAGLSFATHIHPRARASLLRSRCGVRLIIMVSSWAICPSSKCWSRCAHHAHVACSASRAWSTRRPSSMRRKASASAITQSPSARFPIQFPAATRDGIVPIGPHAFLITRTRALHAPA